MFGMSKRRTGLPGIMTGYGGGTFDVDGTEVIPQIDPNEIRYTPEAQRAMDNAPRLQEGQKRQSFWQGGDKFTVRDGIAGALAAVGDGFSTWANGPSAGGATAMLIGGRGKAMEEAKKARAASEAAAAAEVQRQRVREEGITDYGRKKEIDVKYEGPEEPGVFEDNAGNRWLYDKKTGQPLGQAPVFVDRNPRYTMQNGAVLEIPNAYGSQGGQQQMPTKPVGKLTMVPMQGGGEPPIPQLQMNPQAQFYLDEAKKQEMLEEARNYGRGYMQRMGY